jgi:hypothetical protein
MPALVAKL